SENTLVPTYPFTHHDQRNHHDQVTETMMPRTAALKPEQVPADSKPTPGAFTKNIGFTPNMMATFAQSPIAFNSWATLLGSLSRALDVKTRDSIGLAVSEA